MEETETTIYCDATGREIEDGFETLTMVLRRSGGAFGTSERTVGRILDDNERRTKYGLRPLDWDVEEYFRDRHEA